MQWLLNARWHGLETCFSKSRLTSHWLYGWLPHPAATTASSALNDFFEFQGSGNFSTLIHNRNDSAIFFKEVWPNNRRYITPHSDLMIMQRTFVHFLRIGSRPITKVLFEPSSVLLPNPNLAIRQDFTRLIFMQPDQNFPHHFWVAITSASPTW